MSQATSNLQPYIDLGWYTVPLKGQLTRLEDGSKTIPLFEKEWKVRYSETRNTTPTNLGGVLTGAISDIIAIDCDNTQTYRLFRALDPGAAHVYVSKGKGKEAGTIIYRFDTDLAKSFSVNNDTMSLDFYSDGGFVYLPTDSNRTKETLPLPLPEVTTVPPAIKLVLQQLHRTSVPGAPAGTAYTNVITANCQAPLVEQFVSDKKFMPGLFKVLTPQSFRQEPDYIEQGYLHPNQVPQGRGSEYLSRVSAILGADISICQEIYTQAMILINSLFTDSMPDARLDTTILDPMLNKKASINGVPIWKYNAEWSQHRLILQAKRQVSLELCFDDCRNLYYVVDATNLRLRAFNRDSELMAYIDAAAISPPKKQDVKKSLPIANVGAYPHKPFGFNESDDPAARILNSFVQSPELAIFNNPEQYASRYKRPNTILRYMETLVPEHDMRTYLLRFLHTKLKTFKYSPVVLYFMGAHGSGKDVLVRLIEKIIGNVARPTTREFLEVFNGWILDNYFVQLDEYGNQLTSARDREEALGKIKAYTGKRQVQIRQMRTDGFHYLHNLTVIMTANKNPLMLEDGDRRIAFFSTPSVLADQDWVIDQGGMTTVVDELFVELKDFCYYLSTEVDQLSGHDYMKPPESIGKQELIADSMYAAARIAYVLKHNMQQYLINLAEDFAVPSVTKAIKLQKLTSIELDDLYAEMTDHKGETRSLYKAIRQSGAKMQPTTKEGQKAYNIQFNYNPWVDTE